MTSLRARVTVVATLVLLIFVGLASLVLEHAFEASARSARQERLLGQLYLLMAEAETEGDGLRLPSILAEARFSLADSGLYAQVSNAAGQVVWRSPSAIGEGIPFNLGLAPGEQRFQEMADDQGRRYFVKGYGVIWSIGPAPRGYTFSVAEDLTKYQQELAQFRASLAGWLIVLSLVLVAALVLALHWGLAPLRRVADEVAAVEAGQQQRLVGTYPLELRALTDNLNALLAHELARQTRLGHALADLAHSLKTPLAVMRGTLAEGAQPGAVVEPKSDDLSLFQRLYPPLKEQIDRMDAIVAYQLERARSRPVAKLAAPVCIDRTLQRLLASMERLHAERPVEVETNLQPGLQFRGVDGDLMEVLGNLLDNAFKWGRRRVRIAGHRDAGILTLSVEDDGPGISEGQARDVIERGTRADMTTPGHGIGLAVVREICSAYGGGIDISASALGGAQVRVWLMA